MPNPDPSPRALRLITKSISDGLWHDISNMAPRDWQPRIRLSVDKLTQETSVKLQYQGGLAFSIQEWQEVRIDTPTWLTPAAKYFKGYIGKLSSTTRGPKRLLDLTFLDGNIKLIKGAGAYDGQLTTPVTWPAGTTDRAIIQALFGAHLADVLTTSATVANLFNLSAPLTLGAMNMRQCLEKLQALAPSTIAARFYVTFDLATFDWVLRWFDANTVATSAITLGDSAVLGANEANYWAFQRIRDGVPIVNRWTVRSTHTGNFGSANDTQSQTDLGMQLGGQSDSDSAYSIADCQAEAARILRSKSRARESFPGIVTHQPLLLTGPQKISIKNDLEPGITTPTPFPVANATLTLGGGGLAEYSVDLGDRLLALGEDDPGQVFSTRPTIDFTAPAVPDWVAGSGWVTTNYICDSGLTTVTLHVIANTESDFRRYRFQYRYYTNNNPSLPGPWRDAGYTYAPDVDFVFDNQPSQILIGFQVFAQDYTGNQSDPSVLRTVTTPAIDTLTPPTGIVIDAVGIVFYGMDRIGPDRAWVRFHLTDTTYRCLAHYKAFFFSANGGPTQDYAIGGGPYENYDLALGTTYTLQIKTVVGDQQSAYSTGVTFTTPTSWLTTGQIPFDAVALGGGLGGAWRIDEQLPNTLSTTFATLVDTLADGGRYSFRGTVTTIPGSIAVANVPAVVKPSNAYAWTVAAYCVKNGATGVAAPTGLLEIKLRWLDATGATISTVTVYSQTAPAFAWTTYTGQATPPSGAAGAQIVIRYSGITTAFSEELHVGYVALDEIVKAYQLGAQAVKASNVDTGVPAAIYNGNMEIPNVANTFPDAWAVGSGNVYRVVGSPNTTGMVTIELGNNAGTNVLISPLFHWSKYSNTLRPSRLWVRFQMQATNMNGPGRSASVKLRCYGADRVPAPGGDLDLYTDTGSVYSPDLTTSAIQDITVMSSTALPIGTVYCAIIFTAVTTATGQVLSIDSLEIQIANGKLAANLLDLRDLSAGTVNARLRAGTTIPTGAQSDRDFQLWPGNGAVAAFKTLGLTQYALGQPYNVGWLPYDSLQPFAVAKTCFIAGLHSTRRLALLLHSLSYFINTTNNGLNYWTITLDYFNSASGVVNLATVNTSTGAANTWTPIADTSAFNVNPIPQQGLWLRVSCTPTGSPGSIYLETKTLVADVLA